MGCSVNCYFWGRKKRNVHRFKRLIRHKAPCAGLFFDKEEQQDVTPLSSSKRTKRNLRCSLVFPELSTFEAGQYISCRFW